MNECEKPGFKPNTAGGGGGGGAPGPMGPPGPQGPQGEPGSFPDAPVDGKIYGRKNEDWAEVTGGAVSSHNDLQSIQGGDLTADEAYHLTLAERDAQYLGGATPAATDGGAHFILDAPRDGTPYARQDGDWMPTTGGGTGTGDMLKSIYDLNNDGIVNQADRAKIAETLEGVNKTDIENAIAETHMHTNKAAIDKITDTGDGTKALTNDGTYKTFGGGGETGIFPVYFVVPGQFAEQESRHVLRDKGGTFFRWFSEPAKLVSICAICVSGGAILDLYLNGEKVAETLPVNAAWASYFQTNEILINAADDIEIGTSQSAEAAGLNVVLIFEGV